MKKLKAIVITIGAILMMMGLLGDPGLAQTHYCYLPLISFDPTPVVPPVTPVTPELVVGTWVMTTIETGSTDFYLHIGADGSLAINDYPADTEHLPGNWGIIDGAFLGHFVNLNLQENNTGDLEGTIINGVFTLKFIEHWHSPFKVIPYTASRI